MLRQLKDDKKQSAHNNSGGYLPGNFLEDIICWIPRLNAEAIHFVFQNIKFPDIMRGLEEGEDYAHFQNKSTRP